MSAGERPLSYSGPIHCPDESCVECAGVPWLIEESKQKVTKVSPTTADGLLRLALAIERLATAIERHR